LKNGFKIHARRRPRFAIISVNIKWGTNMEIREQHNLARLFVESFVLVNRCGGALVAYLLVALLLFAAEMAAVLWLGVPPLLVKLLNIFVGAYLGVVLLRIFGAKAEKTDESVSNSFSAAVFPSFYQIIFQILYGIFWGVFGFLCSLFLRSNETVMTWIMQLMTHTAGAGTIASVALTVLALAAVPLFIGARLLYAPVAIALRSQGPIEAITYSFQLTAGSRVFTALGTLIIMMLLPLAFVAAVLYAGYVTIPLYFADSFNLANLSPAWIGVLAAVGLLYIFILLALPALLVLVFLNQDYGYNRDSFTPQAELKITSQETQVFGADNNILPPGAGNLVRPEDVRQVQITKSSVRTEADHSMQEHLEQVYQPKPEDLVQYSEEEDRMPTILFDDDMARQIEQERTMWESKQTQDKLQKGEDDAPSVKMSK